MTRVTISKIANKNKVSKRGTGSQNVKKKKKEKERKRNIDREGEERWRLGNRPLCEKYTGEQYPKHLKCFRGLINPLGVYLVVS